MSIISFFQNIYWREPVWLLLCFQPILIILIKKLIQKNNISQYAEKKLQPWVVFPHQYAFYKHILSKNTMYLIAWLLFSIALAGPRTPISQPGNEDFTKANIMLVVDLSLSMKAMDIEPNRLRRAKFEIYELLEKAKKHRIGIIVFSARSHMLVPLTSDHEALLSYVESMDKLSFPTIGSNPFDAILLAQSELKNSKGKSSIILLSDGDFDKISDEQIKTLQKVKIPLYALGIGTPEGEAIPLKDGTWLKYQQQHIVSKMNIGNMKNLVTKLNGEFSPVYDDDSDWDKIYNQGVSRLNTSISINRDNKILWKENFSWFLVPAIFLFIFSLNIYSLKIAKDLSLVPITFIFILFIPNNNTYALEIGQTDEQIAYRAYINGNYGKAEQYYKNIEIEQLYQSYIGQANSLYKMGHYNEAIQKFSFAVLNAKNDSQRGKALYNLGNSYFKTGKFSLAITTYKDSLRYQPNNIACLHNIKISQILKNNLQQRLKEKQRIITLSRQGNGPRSSNVADGTEINENTSVSMGDNKNSLSTKIPLPLLPNMKKDTIQKLLIYGLKNIELAAQGNNLKQQPTTSVQQNTNSNIIKAQQNLSAIRDSQHLLWKRLFEIEEGFPAPVEKPRTIPGVKPW